MIASELFIHPVFIESYCIPDSGDTEIQRHGPCPQESYKLVGGGKYISTTIQYSKYSIIKWYYSEEQRIKGTEVKQ